MTGVVAVAVLAVVVAVLVVLDMTRSGGWDVRAEFDEKD